MERSDIGTQIVKLDHERWILDHTPVIRKEEA